jgi:hypothetical protein
VGTVSGDVGVVAPIIDVVELLPPNGLTAVVALVIAPEGIVDSPGPVTDPVTPGDPVMLVEPGDVVIEELPAPGEDVLLPGVDTLELIDDEKDEVGAVGVTVAVCVNISEMPLLPRADMLASGLQGVEVMPVGAGGWLGSVCEVGFVGTCATAVDAHAMPIHMNRGSFIINLPVCDSPEIVCNLPATRRVRSPARLERPAERVAAPRHSAQRRWSEFTSS